MIEALLILLILLAIFALQTRNMVGAVVLMSVFSIMGNLGVLILPDVYTRLQASSTCATTSVFSVFIACMIIAAVGSGVGTVIFIWIVFKTERRDTT